MAVTFMHDSRARPKAGPALSGWAVKAMAGLPAIVPGLAAHRNASRLKAALARHPVFRPPYPGASAEAPHQVAENFAYFLSQQHHRRAHLAFFLSRFDDPADDAVLDRWLDTFGPALVPGPAHRLALTSHDPAWSGRYGGLNIVLDIAITLTAGPVAAGRDWRWVADATETGAYAVLAGGGRRLDPIAAVAQCCHRSARDGLAPVRTALAL